MVPKFRCWDEPNKTMRFNDEIVIWSGQVYINEKKKLDSIIKGYSCLPKHLMQSTGLKDKNGVEIFEGDVLTSNVQPCKMVNPIKDGYGVVRFENGMFKLGAISLVTFISKMEVIGNVWENPNLLEQANEN